MTARVLLAEAQQRTREALAEVLSASTEVDLVGESADGQGTLALVVDLAPDVAVVDFGLASPDGLATMRAILRGHPGTAVVALCNHTDERYLEAVHAAGVGDVVLKARAGEELTAAIARASQSRPARPAEASAEVAAVDVAEDVAAGPVRAPAASHAPEAMHAGTEESSGSRLNSARQPEIPRTSPGRSGPPWQTEGYQHMELLDALQTDVEGLYERVTGESFPREQFRQVAAPLPPQVEPINYLRQELEQLKAFIDLRMNPAASPAQNHWLPVADVIADADRYTVRVELPGLNKQDIKLAIGDNVIRIEGERSLDLPPNTQVVTCERVYGPFERWITFPFQINKSDLSIRFENGILEVSVTRVAHPLGNLESVNFS